MATKVTINSVGGSSIAVSGQPDQQSIRTVGVDPGIASGIANTALNIANAALNVANTANINSTVAIQSATAAFDKANSANILAFNTGVGANTWANTKLANTTGTFNGTLTIANNLIINSNVGIGTASPTSNLHVVGTANITGTTLINSYTLSSTSLSDGAYFTINRSATGLHLSQGYPILWSTSVGNLANPVRLVGGRVTGLLEQRSGVDPQNFAVYGTYTDASNYERINLTANSSGHYVLGEKAGTGSARPLYLGANNATAVTIGTDGNVGIGTTTPRSPLEVYNGIRLTSTAGGNPAGHTIVIGNDLNGRLTTPSIKFASGDSIISSITNGVFMSMAIRFTLCSWLTGNASQTAYDFTTFGNSWTGVTIPGYTGNILRVSSNINLGANAVFNGINLITGDDSANTIYNTLTGLRVDVSGGNNSTSTRYAASFIGGNIGIGTTTPTSNLHVIGDANVSNNIISSNLRFISSNSRIYSTSSDNIVITNGAQTNKQALILEAGAGAGGLLVSRGSSSMSFGNDSGGQVGIGSTNWGGISFSAVGNIAFSANNGMFRFSGDTNSYNFSNGVIQVVATSNVGFYIRFTKDTFTPTSNVRANDVFTVSYTGDVVASRYTANTGNLTVSSSPALDLTQTWGNSSVTYTATRLNVTDTASAAASLLMDLQVGGSSKFVVSRIGTASATGSFSSYTSGGSASPNFWAASNTGSVAFGGSLDAFLSRRGAANLRFGDADAAAPVAQTLSVQSVVAGTTNAAGANFTITGSQGTGTGAGGSIIFQVAPAGSSGTAQNALATALTIDSTKLATFEGRVASRFGYTFGSPQFYDASIGSGAGFGIHNAQSSVIYGGGTAVAAFEDGGNGIRLSGTRSLGWVNGSALTDVADVRLWRDATNTLALRNSTAAQAFNIYNSYTDGSNYSRLTMFADGSANYYIGTQKAGTGTSASLFVGTGAGGGVAGNGTLFLAGSSIQFVTQAGNVFNITAAGMVNFNSDNAYDIGGSAGNRPRNVYAGTSVTPGRGVIVASLPTPVTGMIARVTDALAPTIGTTVTGGGAVQALVWYNGANWSVIGV